VLALYYACNKEGIQNKAFVFLVIGKAHDERYVTLCFVEALVIIIIQIKDRKARTIIVILKAVKNTL